MATRSKIAQITNLINEHGNLNIRYFEEMVERKINDYIVFSVDHPELAKTIILGCILIDKQSYSTTEIRHLVVSPEIRRKGVGAFLVKEALRKIETPFVYATIDLSNKFSRKIFEQKGFSCVSSYRTQMNEIGFYLFRKEGVFNKVVVR